MNNKKMHSLGGMLMFCVVTVLFLLTVFPTPAAAAPGDISTIAGGYIGDGGPATSARINNPAHIAVSADGTKVYIVDTYNQRIRMVSSGTITTVAGNGISAFAGDGGQATSASINEANGIAVDAAGNIFIADSFNQRIRKVTPAGVISTIAGTGSLGIGSHNDDNIPATTATLFYPYSVATTTTGVIYIADTNNHRLRRIALDGTISTVAGSSTPTFGGDGGQAWGAYLNYPTDVTVDTAGNIYIADTYNHRIRKIDTSNVITTVAGNGTAGFSGDDGLATSASLDTPYGVVVDAAGNIYIADTYNNRIRRVDIATGFISTVVGSGLYDYSGDGGLATSAGLRYPTGLALDGSGNLYIGDQFNDCIRKVTGGNISTIAGSPLNAFYGNGGPATSASLNYAHGVGADASGNVYIADTKNMRIRKVTSAGVISVVAGNGTEGSDGDGSAAVSANLNNPYGVTADVSGNIYIADSYNNRIRKVDASSGNISTWAGDGTPAVLNGPRGVAVDAAGNVYIADTDNHRVRKVNTLGTISTIAGTGTGTYNGDNITAATAALNTPTAVAVDAGGNIYIADSGNNRIRKILVSTGTGTGNIITVAGDGTYGYSGDGGLATSANLATPYGVAVNAAGTTIYIADFYNSKVRKVVSGMINTVVGNGISDVPYDVPIDVFVGFSGDGGPSAPAGYSILNNPYGVAVDPAGNVYIADVNNWRIRKVSETTAPTLSSVHIASNNATATRAKTGDTVTVTITASEPISAPTVTIAGRAATVTGSVASWSANTVMTGSDTQGLVSFSIASRDLAGNTGSPVSAVTDTSSVTFDRTAPTVAISAPSAPAVKSGVTVTYTVTYTGADAVTLANATLNTTGTANGTAVVSGTGTASRTVTISGITGEGTLGISIAAGTASDLAGNTALASGPSTTFSVDNTAPTLVISAPSSTITNTGPVAYTVTYTGANSVTLTNPNVTLNTSGTATGTAVVSGTGTASRTVTISSITGNGTLGISIAAGTASDLAGNTAIAAGPSAILDVDNIAPTLVISAPSSTLTNTGPVTYTVDYTGADAVTLANPNVTLNTTGSASGTVAVSGSGTASRTVTISGITGNGTLSISITAGTASDLAGNITATAGPSATFNVDNTAPTVAISAPSASAVKSGVTVTYTVTYTGADAVTLANATLNATGSATGSVAVSGSGTASRTVTISGITGEGTLGISIAAGTASDLAGNTALATGPSATFNVDSTAPTVVLSSVASNPTGSSPIPVTVHFSESVTDFTSGIVAVTNGTVGSLVGSGADYVFAVTPLDNGTVTVSIPAVATHDAAGNGNTASNTLARTFDSVQPVVTISSTAPNSTNVSPIPVTVHFSKDVADFASGDVIVSNGNLSAFSGSGTDYSFNVTPTGDFTVTVSIAANVAHDLAANGNLAAVPLTRTYDTAVPTVTISSTAPNPTNAPIPVTVTFNEAVIGFLSSDVTISNGTIGLFTAVSGTAYTFNVTPTADGTVTVNVAANVAQDAAGNNNNAAVQLALTYDSAQPTVTLSSLASNQTKTSPIPVTVTFSEAVTGFIATDVSVSNGAISDFTGTGTTYTFNIAPSANGAVTVNVAGNVAQDAAGNGNSAALQLTRTYDTVAPTLSISAPSLTLADQGVSVTYTVTYTGADAVSLADPNVSLNATGTASASSIAVTGAGTASRTVTISNITGFGGTIGITIAAGTASDQAGNPAAGAGPSATFTVDNGSGDLNGSGLDVTDALKALRIAAGLDTPTASETAHGDVAPLLNGIRQPDGKISSADVVAILRKVAGLTSW